MLQPAQPTRITGTELRPNPATPCVFDCGRTFCSKLRRVGIKGFRRHLCDIEQNRGIGIACYLRAFDAVGTNEVGALQGDYDEAILAAKPSFTVRAGSDARFQQEFEAELLRASGQSDRVIQVVRATQ
jgi:hypothetical protein